MIDIGELAKQVAAILGPAAAALGSSAAADAFCKEFGKDAWNLVKSLWEKLQPASENDATLSQAAAKVASDATEEDRETLEIQIRKALKRNPEIQNEIARLLRQAKKSGGREVENYFERVTVHGDFVIGQKFTIK